MALAIVLNLATPPGKDNNTPVETQGESDIFYGHVGWGMGWQDGTNLKQKVQATLRGE